jgi:hypothetical protein
MGSGRAVLECHAAEEATGVRQARCGGGCSGADAGSDAGTEEVARQRVRGRTGKGMRGPVQGKKKGKWARPNRIVNFLIYSNNLQTSSNCFD